MGEVVELDKYRRDRQRQQAAENKSRKKRERLRESRHTTPCRPDPRSDRNDFLEDDPA